MKCENCKSHHDGSYASGRFCNFKCARSFSTKKIKQGKRGIRYSQKIYFSRCKLCKKAFSTRKKILRSFCTVSCRNQVVAKRGGIASVLKQNRRSKNEIHFHKLCKQHFNNVKHNERIFDGWDADIILPDLKIAVLWDGIWHHKQIGKSHSLSQVQTRDKIRIEKIKSCGYIPYIINDFGGENPKFVENEFQKFIQHIAAEWNGYTNHIGLISR